MERIKIDFNKAVGAIKPMNGTNNGPRIPLDPVVGQNTGNMQLYKELEMPFARTHDAALSPNFGGEHTVDIHCIFPDFDADVNDPASYDFELTDRYVQTIELTGTKTFYRLGESIEFRPKKYAIVVPKDFKKWAQICEHIIRHFNEGWANGFHYNIEYWEIWNEADGDMADEGANKRTWAGTPEEFYEMYCVAARHLKDCFPNLKIGGPAMSNAYACGWKTDFEETSLKWLEGFFEYITTREYEVPLDFFSWHCYDCEPKVIGKAAEFVKGYLIKYGYENAESVMNEWNYVTSFSDDGWVYSLYTMQNTKGAAYVAAYMTVAQDSPVDILMYYDASPGVTMNGLFRPIDLEKGRTYYTMQAFRDLRRLGTEVETVSEADEIYTLAAKNDANDYGIMVTYFTNNDDAQNKVIELDMKKVGVKELDFYILSETKNLELVKKEFSSTDNTVLYFDMEPNSVLLIKSKNI